MERGGPVWGLFSLSLPRLSGEPEKAPLAPLGEGVGAQGGRGQHLNNGRGSEMGPRVSVSSSVEGVQVDAAEGKAVRPTQGHNCLQDGTSWDLMFPGSGGGRGFWASGEEGRRRGSNTALCLWRGP